MNANTLQWDTNVKTSLTKFTSEIIEVIADILSDDNVPWGIMGLAGDNEDYHDKDAANWILVLANNLPFAEAEIILAEILRYYVSFQRKDKQVTPESASMKYQIFICLPHERIIKNTKIDTVD